MRQFVIGHRSGINVRVKCSGDFSESKTVSFNTKRQSYGHPRLPEPFSITYFVQTRKTKYYRKVIMPSLILNPLLRRSSCSSQCLHGSDIVGMSSASRSSGRHNIGYICCVLLGLIIISLQVSRIFVWVGICWMDSLVCLDLHRLWYQDGRL